MEQEKYMYCYLFPYSPLSDPFLSFHFIPFTIIISSLVKKKKNSWLPSSVKIVDLLAANRYASDSLPYDPEPWNKCEILDLGVSWLLCPLVI